MTQEEFNKIVESRIELIRSTLTAKGEEYTSKEDVFESFTAMANGLSLHDDSTKVLWELLVKHLYSIRKMINSEVMPDIEHVKEKIGDAINYLILLEGIFIEDINTDEAIYNSLLKAKTNYEKGKLYNKESVERLSMWTSNYSQNIDMLGLVKMAANGSDGNIDKVKYDIEGEKGY